MIKLENVTKYFQTNEGKNYLLKDVSLTLPDANIGILGRNGAGKSTLMRMLGRIEFPNSGKIISPNSFSWPLGLSGGFVGSMTGKANVKFVCRLYGMNNIETKEIVTYVKEFSELESRYYPACISKQILFSNWYAHYKFYWEHQIDWVNEQLNFNFFRDKIPLSLWLTMLTVITGLIWSLSDIAALVCNISKP